MYSIIDIKKHMNMFEHQNEAKEILATISQKIPKIVDGKKAILELKAVNYQWRQMEWIGWYFEYFIFNLLSESITGSKGPKYGNTTFDFQKEFVWDIKVHPMIKPNGSKNEPMILNDKEAIENCISQNNGVGFIVIKGNAQFDDDGSFKQWHDILKGGHSNYEIERIRRGSNSRRRKTEFIVQSIEILFFTTIDQLNRGIEERWISFFQEGMRNADGSPRRAKYAINTSLIPEEYIVISKEIH